MRNLLVSVAFIAASALPAWAQAETGSGGLPLIALIPLGLLLVGVTAVLFLKRPDAMKKGMKNIGDAVAEGAKTTPAEMRAWREKQYFLRHGHYPPRGWHRGRGVNVHDGYEAEPRDEDQCDSAEDEPSVYR